MSPHFLGLYIVESPEIRSLLLHAEVAVDVSTFLGPVHCRITRNQKSTRDLGSPSDPLEALVSAKLRRQCVPHRACHSVIGCVLI